ncbi:MAG TPA: tail fiber domain-containing protein [Flavobacteriales bacterium]|nr:tail fiber domain-containing protein [Flavobacteriales bacterium]HQW86605.1 tail fiber domain-containing protein [Flavobacteriales bacterium]
MSLRSTLFASAMAVVGALSAQPFTPYGAFSYQAVVRDALGNALPNQLVNLRIGLGPCIGAVTYWETHLVTTDDIGMVNLRVGQGTPEVGTFEGYEWTSNCPHRLEVQIDLTGGTSFTALPPSTISAAPYSIISRYSRTMMDSALVVDLFNEMYVHPDYRFGVGVDNPVNKLDVEGAAVIGASYGGTNTAPANGLLVQGNVGIGTTTPGAFNLLVNGSAAKPGGGSWSNSSDLRLKKNVAPLTGSLNTLLGLRGVTFEYKDPVAIHELPGTRIGFIAQEVEQVLPDWVEEVDGYKRLTIRGFEALAVEALRELQAENTALRAELETLRGQQTRLMSALERTEARLDAIEHGTAPANAER